jgi:hypothetical protein
MFILNNIYSAFRLSIFLEPKKIRERKSRRACEFQINNVVLLLLLLLSATRAIFSVYRDRCGENIRDEKRRRVMSSAEPVKLHTQSRCACVFPTFSAEQCKHQRENLQENCKLTLFFDVLLSITKTLVNFAQIVAKCVANSCEKRSE